MRWAFTDRTEKLDTFILGDLNIIRYRTNNELDGVDQDYNGGLHYSISELWDASAEARYTMDSQIDRDIETTGLLLGTTEREHQHYAAGTGYRLTEATSTSIKYAYDRDDFSKSDFVDSVSQEAGLGFTYDLSSISMLTYARINIGYNSYYYTEVDVNSFSGLAGIGAQFSETLGASIDAGYQYTRSAFQAGAFTPDKDIQTIQGPIGKASLNYRGEMSDASLSVYHFVKPLSGIPGTAMRTSVRLDAHQKITYKFHASLMMEYFLNKADQGQQASEDIDQETWRAQLGLSYDITNDLSCEGAYRYTRLNDHIDGQDSPQNLVYLRVVWQYPIPH